MTAIPTPQEVAQAVADHLYPRDRTVQSMGITIEAVGPGSAVLRMTVSDDMVNGYDIAHGGVIFTLADAAFAYACNAGNRIALAVNCTISFIAPAARGDVLTARAEETHVSGRNGIYDVSVSNGKGEIVALFRGNSRVVKGQVVDLQAR